jgi:hypothetical protein
LVEMPSTSLSTPLPSAEFGAVAGVRGKGRITPGGVGVGSGVVEELRRVYEERCRIVRSQEPGRKTGEGGLKIAGSSRGGMGIGIGKIN